MTQYREYTGLYGDKVRVPADSFAPPLRFYPRTPFPFATIAQRSGEARDSFVGAATRAGVFFHSAAVNKSVRHLLGRDVLAAI